MKTSDVLPDYAELHCVSNFSFLRGASHAEELVTHAKALGYSALAVTDECSFAGVVRAHVVAKQEGLKLLIGTELVLKCGVKLVLLAQNRAGYGSLSTLITLARRRAGKGHYHLSRNDLADGVPNCLALWVASTEATAETGQWLEAAFPRRTWIAFERHLQPGGPGSAGCARTRMLSACDAGFAWWKAPVPARKTPLPRIWLSWLAHCRSRRRTERP